ncbi:hypothetical protein BH23CHL2_BH23CHL2_08770 [soil metagenome]
MSDLESEIRKQVDSLTPEVRRRLVDEYIEPDLYRYGAGEARIRDYFIHVWAIIGYLPAVGCGSLLPRKQRRN